MTWTILILVLGIALYLFGGMLIKQGNKPTTGSKLIKKSIKVIAVIIIAVTACRLYVPYYLVDVNPAILQDMAQNMQAQKAEEGNKAVRKYVRSNMDKLTADAPIMGKENAEKTIFLFSAFSCGYCRRVHAELERVVADNPDVRVVMKNFSIHGVLSDVPARAVIAAKLQGNDKAAALDHLLMAGEYYTQDDVKDQAKAPEKIQKNVMKLAAQAGIDTSRLEKDMNGEVVARELAQVRDLADRFQIGGTPFLIINDQAFPGAIPYDQIIKALK